MDTRKKRKIELIYSWSVGILGTIIFLGVAIFLASGQTNLHEELVLHEEQLEIPTAFYLAKDASEQNYVKEAQRWIEINNPCRLFEIYDEETSVRRKFVEKKRKKLPLQNLPLSQTENLIASNIDFRVEEIKIERDLPTMTTLGVLSKENHSTLPSRDFPSWTKEEGNILLAIPIPSSEEILKSMQQDARLPKQPVVLQIEFMPRFCRCRVKIRDGKTESCGNQELDQLAINKIYDFLKMKEAFFSQQNHEKIQQLLVQEGIMEKGEKQVSIALDYRYFPEIKKIIDQKEEQHE